MVLSISPSLAYSQAPGCNLQFDVSSDIFQSCNKRDLLATLKYWPMIGRNGRKTGLWLVSIKSHVAVSHLQDEQEENAPSYASYYIWPDVLMCFLLLKQTGGCDPETWCFEIESIKIKSIFKHQMHVRIYQIKTTTESNSLGAPCYILLLTYYTLCIVQVFSKHKVTMPMHWNGSWLLTIWDIKWHFLH